MMLFFFMCMHHTKGGGAHYKSREVQQKPRPRVKIVVKRVYMY